MTPVLSSSLLARLWTDRSPAAGSWHRTVLVRLGLSLAALAPALAEGDLWFRHPLTSVVNLLVDVGFVGAGALLSADAEQRVTGWILIASGVTRPLGWADEWPWGPWPLYSAVFGFLGLTLGAWALLRFPQPRMDARGRRFMVVLAVWLIGIPAVEVCVARPGWVGDRNVGPSAWWPYLWPDRQAFDLISDVFTVGATVLAACYLLLMLERLKNGGRQDRAVRLPVVAAGALTAVASATVEAVTALAGPSDEIFAVEGMAELMIPIAFLVAFGQQRLNRLSRMVTVLDETDSPVPLLRQVLRHNLGDPALDLAVWSQASRSYLTVDGGDINQPPRQAVKVTGRGGRPLAMLLLDPDAAREHTLLDAALVMTRLTLENLLLSQRLLTADYEARQLVAADLHDGAQSQLCALRLALSKLGEATPRELPLLVGQAERLVDEALRELRDLAHGVYPHTLARAGLGPAIEEKADRLDLIVTLTVPERRLPPEVELTVYFFVCEALTNIYKHAGTDQVTVLITIVDGLVTTEVRDHGEGGADTGGSGIAQLRDRIEAYGGQLELISKAGLGTCLIARIPCV
jgi:signal transduction histidine kinase